MERFGSMQRYANKQTPYSQGPMLQLSTRPKPGTTDVPDARRNLTVTIRPRLCIIWQIDVSKPLRQNILSAIKVMKGRASKKDEEEQEDE